MMIRTTHLGALAAAAGALVAVGLLVLMLVVEVRPAGATFPGQNGRIAYSGFEGPGGPGDPIPTWGDREIYTINPDGGDRVQVTDNHAANAYQADDVRPSYSPDGETIAYAGHDGLDYEIYTINAGGKRMVKVTDNLVNDYEPAYSSDGQQIAYVGLDVPGTGDYDIFTINVDGGGRFNVTDNTTLFDSDPAYSPDGRQKAVETRLAYSASDGNDDEIYTINVGGGGVAQLTDNETEDSDPDYSPDGQKIAYMGNDGDTEIFTIDVDGGGSFNVTHNNTFDYQPSWGSSRRSSSLWPEEGVSQRQ